MVESWLSEEESGVQFPEATCPFGGVKENGGREDEISTRPPDDEAGETGEASLAESSPGISRWFWTIAKIADVSGRGLRKLAEPGRALEKKWRRDDVDGVVDGMGC